MTGRSSRDILIDSLVLDYYSAYVSEEEEHKHRLRRAREDQAVRGRRNIWEIAEGKEDTRWQGYAGENLFKKFCAEFLIGVDKHHDEEGKTIALDFTVGEHLIDVKTKTYNRYPPSLFQVNYNAMQSEKNRMVNLLVFCGYVSKQRVIHLTCWNRRAGFKKVSVTYEKGEMMPTVSGTGMYPADYRMHASNIGQNRPPKELLALLGGRISEGGWYRNWRTIEGKEEAP